MLSYRKEYFKFVGRHCNNCKSTLEEQINNIEGVRKIEINYITNIVMIEFDATLITEQQIRKRLRNTGCIFFNIGLKF